MYFKSHALVLYYEYSDNNWFAYKGNTNRENLTQEAVAFKAEIDRTFMNHVENGKRNVSVETLEKILCNGLDMNFHEFFCNGLFNDKKKGK
jgi:transcriptional regulator with XRE-family HTH domain